ncbi:MAG: SDR family oxidoreductase [Chloroflexi bacterium]|nr:SDR family oxidoreductase [Chloroflexota bacterium]
MREIPDRFAGKRAIVTGASRGIGRAVAERMAAEGARVGLIARGRSDLEDVASVIRGRGGECLVLPADCAIETEVEAAIDTAAATWGGLDVVVSNAGIEPADLDARAHELAASAWELVIATNLSGQFFASKHGLRHLVAGDGGSLVCIGSHCGSLGICINETAYSASKGGVLGMMRVMAADYARSGIRVNMVIPGVIDTPMNGYLKADPELFRHVTEPILAGRLGTPDEVAAGVLWLASDDASYCIGTALVIDGGVAAV